jgi:hypothetical protein
MSHPIPKIKRGHGSNGRAPTSKCEALSSNPSTTNKQTKDVNKCAHTCDLATQEAEIRRIVEKKKLGVVGTHL